MKRLFIKLPSILAITTITLFSLTANAGFWSSALGTTVGNSLSAPNGQNYGTNKDAQNKNAKKQQTLAKLGFYVGNFDGNLNSFESRDAIEQFQKHYKLEDTGVLSKEEQNDLLYMHDLLKNYKLSERNFDDSSNEKVSKLFKAIDKLEKRIIDRGDSGFFSDFSSNNYLTDKLKKSRVVIKKEEKEKKIRLAKAKKEQKERLIKAEQERIKSINEKNIGHYINLGNGEIQDKNTRLIWKRCSMGQKWTKEGCSGNADIKVIEKINYADGWRVPTVKELESIIYCSNGDRVTGGYSTQLRCPRDSNSPTINKFAFPNTTPKDDFLASNTYSYEGNLKRMQVDFKDGLTSSTHSSLKYPAKGHIRLVKASKELSSSISSAVKKRKKEISQCKKQGGKKLDGQYYDYCDGTVVDKKRGLMWMQCLLGQKWNGKRCTGTVKTSEIDQKSIGNISSNFAGYNDWRVPNISELESLVYCSNNNRTKRGCAGSAFQKPTVSKSAFPKMAQTYLLSNSSYPNSDYLLWGISTSYGYSRKSNRGNILLVRTIK